MRTSLDGFVAGPAGEMDWISVDDEMFEYAWADELATWELMPEGKSKCKLVLTYNKLPDDYAVSVPAGWHVLLDQLEEALNGRKVFPPFGAEETEAGKMMKSIYADVFRKELPEL